MTTPIPATLFADPAPAHRLERAATALTDASPPHLRGRLVNDGG
jgi:hypothetical protein